MTLTSLTTTTTSKKYNCILKSICQTLYQSCFKTFFICTFNTNKTNFSHFYLNGGLHVVSIRKSSEQMSNFWTIRFLKTESEQNFGFPHIPTMGYRKTMHCERTYTPHYYKQVKMQSHTVERIIGNKVADQNDGQV